MFTVYPCFNFGLRVLVSCTCNICFKLWCFFDLCFSFFYPLAARVFTSFFRFAPLSPTLSPFYWFVLILSSWMLCITLLTLICIGLSWLIWYVLLIFFYLYYQLSIYFILIALFSYQSVVCCINSGRWSHWYVNYYICSLFNNKFNCSSESVVGWICWYINCYICLLYQFVNMLIVIFVHCSMDLNSVHWSITV